MSREHISLGILVLETHENYFVNLCRIAASAKIDLSIFTTKEYLNQIEDEIQESSETTFLLKSIDESMWSYLKRVEHYCRKDIDILIILPLDGNILDFLRYVAFRPACKTVLTIYNVNTWTLTKVDLTSRIDKYLTLPLRKVIFDHVDAIIVEYRPIKEYLDSVAFGKRSFVFTPMLHEGVDARHEREPRRFTIPGHITESRRNYGLVFEALELIPPDRRDEFELHLLGRPRGESGERILARCDRLRGRGFNIGYSNQWIPISEFDRTLQRSRAVICPLHETRKSSGTEEIYGLSKGTGCIGDGVRFGRPIVLPETYEVPAEIQPAVHQYEGPAELSEIILTLLSERYRISRRRAVGVAQQFTLAEQKTRLQAILGDLVEA